MSTPGALVIDVCSHDVRYATMLSGYGLKTVRCSYEELHELTMLFRKLGPGLASFDAEKGF